MNFVPDGVDGPFDLDTHGRTPALLPLDMPAAPVPLRPPDPTPPDGDLPDAS